MKKLFPFLLTPLFLLASPAQAQTIKPCTVEALKVTPLRGVRFAMARDEVLKLTPTLTTRAEKFGAEVLSVAFSSLQEEPIQKMFDGLYFVRPDAFSNFKGVRAFDVKFLDGVVVSYEVTYDNSVKWDSLDEFIVSASKSLNLDGEWAWVNPGSKVGGKQLRCVDFDIHADDTSILDQAMKLTFTARFPANVLRTRRAEEEKQRREEEEKKKRTFKP